MKKATDVAVEAIAKMSSKVKDKDQIAKVAAISAGDAEVGQMVQMLWRKYLMTELLRSKSLRL